MDVFSDTWLYIYFFGFSILVGLLAGLFPAFSLSAFLPVNVLNGLSQIRGFSVLAFRRTLMVIQFTLALVFIILSAFIYRQVDFMLTADYGFDREHLLFVELQDVPYEIFRQEMLNHSSVQNISASSAVLVGGQTWQIGKTANMESNLLLGVIGVDEYFINNFDLTLLAGRNFDPGFATDLQSVILGEKAVQDFGLKTPTEAIGSVVTFENENQMKVIGVVRDFYYRPLFSKTRPLALRYDPDWFHYAAVRFHGEQLPAMLTHLKKTWTQFENPPPLQYIFFDDHLEVEYSAMRDATQILKLAAVFAILIACLGLLGMVIYSVETRTKEIGIRKVVGASTASIALMLSGNFLRLLAIATALGLPLCWLLTTALQQNFAQRAPVSISTFTWPLMGLLTLAVLTIVSQTIKAAQRNPVDGLRNE